MAIKKEWETADLDPKKILLDVNNPRIEVGDAASQDVIRLKLLELEDVLDLARNIEKNNGLFYGERIITVLEGGKQVVLEGNRRVAACQMLLDSSLVPASYRSRFPEASTETKARLRKLSADVAPSRAAAEPILTKRHTEQGAKPWSPVAKMRRAVRLLDRHSVEEAAQILGTSAAQVRKLIRPYKLLKFAMDLKVWTHDERKILEDEKLKTNPYTRFFTLSKTQEALKIHFDENQEVVSSLPAKIFKDQMARIARDFLLPDPANRNRPRCDTRTDPEEYFREFVASPEGRKVDPNAKAPTATSSSNPASGTGGSSSPSGSQSEGGGAATTGLGGGTPATGATKPKTLKPSIFFENLECHVQDDNLIKLTKEMREINHRKRTISASLLLRATFECALVYQLKKKKKWGELMKEIAAKNEGKKGRDPGLSDIINFCKNVQNGVFAENNICKTLASGTTAQAKNYLDAMTHLKYQEADVPTLESVANNLRQVIQAILTGDQ